MRGSKYVPLALAACVVSACERHPAAAPGYESVAGGTLALCAPAPEREYVVWIGTSGGSFFAPGVFLEIPSGALERPTRFTVRIPTSPYAEIEVKANGHETFTFARPVTIGIDYSACGSMPDLDATVWHIEPASKAFLEDMGGVHDALNQRVIFSTMHLSGYAIAN